MSTSKVCEAIDFFFLRHAQLYYQLSYLLRKIWYQSHMDGVNGTTYCSRVFGPGILLLKLGIMMSRDLFSDLGISSFRNGKFHFSFGSFRIEKNTSHKNYSNHTNKRFASTWNTHTITKPERRAWRPFFGNNETKQNKKNIFKIDLSRRYVWTYENSTK